MTSKKSPWWEQVAKAIKQVVSPVTVTAAAMTALVVWQTLPILQAEANEVRSAITNPNSETSPRLRALAAMAHRILFTEIVIVCEILVIGAIAVLLVRFVFYVIRLVAREIRRTRRELRALRQTRARVTASAPRALPPTGERSKAQSQHLLEAPLEKKVYLIPGPEKIEDTRKAAGTRDGARDGARE